MDKSFLFKKLMRKPSFFMEVSAFVMITEISCAGSAVILVAITCCPEF